MLTSGTWEWGVGCWTWESSWVYSPKLIRVQVNFLAPRNSFNSLQLLQKWTRLAHRVLTLTEDHSSPIPRERMAIFHLLLWRCLHKWTSSWLDSSELSLGVTLAHGCSSPDPKITKTITPYMVRPEMTKKYTFHSACSCIRRNRSKDPLPIIIHDLEDLTWFGISNPMSSGFRKNVVLLAACAIDCTKPACCPAISIIKTLRKCTKSKKKLSYIQKSPILSHV